MTVYTKSYSLPDINRGEFLRYAGVSEESAASPEYSSLIDECLALCDGVFTAKVCYTELNVSLEGNVTDFGFAKVHSASLAKNLSGCDRAIIFAATVGKGVDRLIMVQSRLSMSRPLVISALGSERVESLCNIFCKEQKAAAEANGITTVPRFSPGYGDLPLEFQKDIFRLLSPTQRIGISLGENLLMSPSKSVTAILGIRRK